MYVRALSLSLYSFFLNWTPLSLSLSLSFLPSLILSQKLPTQITSSKSHTLLLVLVTNNYCLLASVFLFLFLFSFSFFFPFTFSIYSKNSFSFTFSIFSKRKRWTELGKKKSIRGLPLFLFKWHTFLVRDPHRRYAQRTT